MINLYLFIINQIHYLQSSLNNTNINLAVFHSNVAFPITYLLLQVYIFSSLQSHCSDLQQSYQFHVNGLWNARIWLNSFPQEVSICSSSPPGIWFQDMMCRITFNISSADTMHQQRKLDTIPFRSDVLPLSLSCQGVELMATGEGCHDLRDHCKRKNNPLYLF